MKNPLLLATVVLLFASCASKTVPGKTYSSLLAEGLKGRIRAMEISTYKVDSVKNTLIQDSCCITKVEYNKRGNSIKSETVNLKGVLQRGLLTEYHENGLIKQITYFDKDRKVSYREEFFLDAAGNYASGNAYQEAEKLHRTFKIAGQNEFGQHTKFNWYALDGQLYRAEERTYEGNKKVKEIWTDKNGKVEMDITTKYNEKGEFISEAGIHPFLGVVKQTTTNRIYAYDKKGNVTQISILNAQGKPIRVIKRSYNYN